MRRVAVFVCLCALSAPFSLLGDISAQARAQAKPAHKVKAQLLYRFTQYVVWPESAFENPDSPLKIGVVGNDKILDELEKNVSGKLIGEHPIEIVRGSMIDRDHDCHVVFVDKSKSDSTPKFIGSHRESAMLTVGDAADFTQVGGVIRLFEKDRKLRIEINVDAAERAQLKISSKLLSLAKIVHNGQAETAE